MQDFGEDMCIVLIDDHSALRLAGAATANAAPLARHLQPHTIVLDLGPSRGEPADVIRRLLTASPRSRLVIVRDHDERPTTGAQVPCLSQREREVLGLVARAMSNRQIATYLTITEGTVKRHLRNIFSKLGATSRIDAVNKAIAAALLTAEDRSPLPPGGTG